MSANLAVVGYLFAIGAGVSFVFQQAVNANLSAEIGSPWWAGFVSYLGGTIVMLFVALALRDPWFSKQLLERSHWLSWSGGFFGAIYIAVSILLIPRLGVPIGIAVANNRRRTVGKDARYQMTYIKGSFRIHPFC